MRLASHAVCPLRAQLENVGISGYDPFHDAVDQATMLPGRKSSVGVTAHGTYASDATYRPKSCNAVRIPDTALPFSRHGALELFKRNASCCGSWVYGTQRHQFLVWDPSVLACCAALADSTSTVLELVEFRRSWR